MQKKLWEENKNAAIKILLNIKESNFTPICDDFVKGISTSIEDTDYIDIFYENKYASKILIRKNPKLAISKNIWEKTDKNLIIESISAANIAKTDLVAIIESMLKSDLKIINHEFFERFGEIAVFATLNWLDEEFSIESPDIPYSWKYSLKNQPIHILNWLKRTKRANINSIPFIIKLLNPNNTVVLKFGSSLWIKTEKKYYEKLKRSEKINFMIFLLALGLNNPDSKAPMVVSMSFQIVHDAAKKDIIGYDSWKLLENNAPSNSWWWDWDKCERLRRAYVKKFLDNSWPIEYFLKGIKNEETFKKIVIYCKREGKTRDFILTVKENIVERNVSAKTYHMKIIKDLL